VSLYSRTWFALVLFGLLVLVTRYPHAPGQLFGFDDVNLAYSMGHFDVRISQPQPPGYPLFVLEMRVLYWLRFRRAESILLALALAGSIVALVLLAHFGRRIFGGLCGFLAACLLVFHPVFWHAGITSALRVQLAILSLTVGGACWRAWSGDGRWVVWSAITLGLCAGVRPEIGPVLFPLWAGSALRAPVSWKERTWALGAMGAAVLLWLLPAMFASGGPFMYIRACLPYIADQASQTSGMFGAAPDKWHTTFWRLIVWTCCGILTWTLPGVLAWKRKRGWGMDRDKLAFLALWLLPPLGFAILVHIQDPGQTLAMAPPIALFGGYLFDRALDNLNNQVSRWQTIIFSAASLSVGWVMEFRGAPAQVVWIPLIGLAAGLLLKCDQTANHGYLPHAAAAAFLLAPVLIVNFDLFYFENWYYKGSSTTGFAAAYDRVLSDLNSGLALTSVGHINSTLAVDDDSLRHMLRLAAERPRSTVVVWERGLVAWRKAAYYAPTLPIMVLDHKTIRSGSAPVVAIWNGNLLTRRIEGPAPLTATLPEGGRIVWLLNPRTEFYTLVSQSFPLTPAGTAYYTDLPAGNGTCTLGDYRLAW
jgi:hypothetical protein